jgi:hypothetical protein
MLCVVGLSVLPAIGASAASPTLLGPSPDVWVGPNRPTPPNAYCSEFQWSFTNSSHHSPTFQTLPAGNSGVCGNVYVGGSSVTEDFLGWSIISDGMWTWQINGSAGWVWDGPNNNNWVALGSNLTGAISTGVDSGGNVGAGTVWIAAD